MCSKFCQALGQVVTYHRDKKMSMPGLPRNDSISGEASAATCCWNGPRSRSPWVGRGARAGSLVLPAQGQVPVPTVTKALWLCSKRKMPLRFHSAQEEIKHESFCFFQPLSVISFATMLSVGIFNYLTHICLHDDLAQVKGELSLGSRHLWAGSA